MSTSFLNNNFTQDVIDLHLRTAAVMPGLDNLLILNIRTLLDLISKDLYRVMLYNLTIQHYPVHFRVRFLLHVSEFFLATCIFFFWIAHNESASRMKPEDKNYMI